MGSIFFVLSILTVQVAEADSSEATFGSSNAWLKLLHYKKGILGGYESQVDGPRFFLAKDGKSNPKSELKATIAALKSSEKARCQFPARLRLIQKHLQKKFPDANCPEYEDFKRKLNPDSVSLIFSSYYLNNPSSAFGHTFYRINKPTQNGQRLELLDSAINYAAVVDTRNSLVYAFRGIFGMFEGHFSVMPYFVKVRKYAAFESRDLWSYDLNLSQEQLMMMVEHIWELGHTYYDYFYFSENCSYHILSTIEAVVPELDLTDKLPRYVLPADTIKVLYDYPDFVKSVTYRPSQRTTLFARAETMTASELRTVRKLVDTKEIELIDTISDEPTRARVIDAATDLMIFEHGNEMQAVDNPFRKFKQKLALLRAKIKVDTEEVKVVTPSDKQPHIGHDSARMKMAYVYGSDSKSGAEFGLRLALHDLTDPVDGYPNYAEIEFADLNFRFNFEEKSLWFSDLTVFQVKSFTPTSIISSPISWKIRVGVDTVRDKVCDHCEAGSFGVGGGYTTHLSPNRRLSLSLLADAELSGSPDFGGSVVRLGVGPYANLRYILTEDFIVMAEGYYRYSFFVDERDSFRASLISNFSFDNSFSILAGADLYAREKEARFGFQYYF